jgi:poly(hydroxyalkanoate) depolymerase family esterase
MLLAWRLMAQCSMHCATTNAGSRSPHSRLSKGSTMHDCNPFDGWPYPSQPVLPLHNAACAFETENDDDTDDDAGGSAASAAAQFVSRIHHCHAGSRPYKFFIPGNNTGRALPLLVMLHGCNQSADDFARGTGMNAIAERHGCYVVYPAQSPCANQMQCWNWHRPEDQRREHGEPAIIADLTRTIAADYPVDRRRIYVAGLSAGGAMAAILGSTYPDLYAAVGIHSGLPYGAAHDLMSAYDAMTHGVHRVAAVAQASVVPTIVFHGDCDTTVHPANADHLLRHSTGSAESGGIAARACTEVIRQSAGRSGRYAHTRTVCMDHNRKIFFEQWLVHGAGHAWSGGRPGASFTDTDGPDASREMMRFFRGIALPAA